MRILSLAPLHGPGLDILRGMGEVQIDPWNAHVPIKLHSAPELRARLEGVEVLIVEADHISAEVLAGTSVRFLGVCRGDPNNVDVPAATASGVTVIRTPGRNANGVAELAVGLMLALLRSIVAADDDIRAARWVIDGRIAQQRYLGRELSSCVVGLVGYGAVGRATATRLRALGAEVIAFDPYATDADVPLIPDLADLVGRSDIISIHAPMTEATRGMVGAQQLAALRPGSYLVNTARYDVVAEPPMLEALADGRLAGAAFDHFHNEFLPADHPLVSMPNVILTPHIGGSTVQTIQTHTTQIAEALVDAMAGRANAAVVNPEALHR
jgi:D-3-phosphoglycerate dehydrogenase / 2-oxoglutarate reductase